MHPRLIPGNGDVALVGFEDHATARRYVQGQMMQVCVPMANLLRAPDGALDRQVLLGHGFEVIAADRETGFSFGRCVVDGYVGYVRSELLAATVENTHRVCAVSTHVYPTANMKTLPLLNLSFGALVAVVGRDGDFYQLHGGGFIPFQHLRDVKDTAKDFVSVFEVFLGTPYLWGGDSTQGMDCSGAVQLAMHAAGLICPRDSDMQECELGTGTTSHRRGDLVFWKGHVAVMVDGENIIHANAHHMTVAIEPLEPAIARIAENGGGDVTARRRL